MSFSVPSRETSIRASIRAVAAWASDKAQEAEVEAQQLRGAYDSMQAAALAELPSQHEIVALRAVQRAADEAEDRLALVRELVAALAPFMGA